MGRSLLLIVVAVILGGSYLTFSALQMEGETGGRRATAQAAVLARQLSESGQAIAVATATRLDGFENAGLFPGGRPYDGGTITFVDYAEAPLAGGAERITITVDGTYGVATHRLMSVFEFDPMDFPGPIWFDVPYATATIDPSATIGGGTPGYEPQIDPRKYNDLDVGEFGLTFNGAKSQFSAAGAAIPSWDGSGKTRTGDLGDGVTTADDVYYAVTSAADVAAGDYIVNSSVTINGNRTIGAPDAITIVRGDATLNGSVTGWGALVVEGNLRVNGTLDWTGLVILRSVDEALTIDLTGNVTITGALLVSQEAFPPGGHVDVTVFRSPTAAWSNPWGRRAAGPGSLSPSSWDLSEAYTWYDHTHRFDRPSAGEPDETARSNSEIRFVDESRGDPQEAYTGLRELLDDLGGTDVQVEFDNTNAHGHATYEVIVDGVSVTGTVSRGFNGTALEGGVRHRTSTFNARDLERLIVTPRSMRSLKKLWDGPGDCLGNEWPYCVGEDRNDRRGALTVRIRRASDGKALYEGAVYWHMQQGTEQTEYEVARDAWRTGVQNGSIPFGTSFRMGGNAEVTYGLVPIVALADRVGFDGNDIRHISTESTTAQAAP